MTQTSHNESTEELTDEWIRHAVTGGTFLGGGGGGSPEDGLAFGRLAVEYGTPTIRPLDEVSDDDLIVTVSAVGAPAATERHVKPADYVRALELVRDHLESRGETVAGIMTNEMGGTATVNGMVQSAVTGLPLVDAACNGRAHPTGPMGSMGLAPTHTTVQAGVGGDPDADAHVELLVEASLETAADTIRQAAQDALGLVAVARNPVTAEYAREHAARGVYDQAVEVGRRIEAASDGDEAAASTAEFLDGERVCRGTVDEVELRTEGGFDVGRVAVADVELTFWNEYMTVERDGSRLATFPDLITVLDAETGEAITTAEIEAGQDVVVVTAPAESLLLGAGMRQRDLFEPVEDVLETPVIEYAFDD